MLRWLRKNIALLVIIVGLAGWGAYSVGSRMLSAAATPPGYAQHCFDSGELASNCVYLADPSATSGWVTDPNMHLELIHYRSGRNTSTDASVIAWAGSDPEPCGFKRVCYVSATDSSAGPTECLVMKIYDAACP